jgi:hypothetical protein
MKEPVVSAYLEGDPESIPDVSVKSIKVFASIFSSYPGAEIIIDDPEGRFLSALYTKPGANITIAAQSGGVETSSNSPVLTFCPFRVIGISNKGVLLTDNEMVQLGSLGGDYVIHLSHPWAMQSDWSNHAYRAKASEIVRKVVSGSNRGFAFTKITIDPTDDAGNITRYKIGESEARFIHMKILPYATIDKQASYSFVDELGGFHLRSFLRMYNQEPKIAILPPRSDAVATLWDEKSTIEQMPLYDGAWWIGRKFLEQIGNFKKVIYVEDSLSQISFVANLPYQPAIPGYTLMKKEYVDNVKVTDVSIYPYRNFEDAVRLNVNNNGVMNEFFQVSVTVDFAPDLAVVGQTALLRIAGYETTKDHWMNGRWLVAGAEHFQKDGRYYSKYLLSRPALNSLPADVNPETLYKV